MLVLVGWSPLEPGAGTLLAVLAALAAAASYAIAGTYVRARMRGVGGIELATGMLVAGAVVLLPFAVASGAPGTPSLAGVASLVTVGVVSTAVAWPVFFRVLAHTTPTAASTVTFIVPAFALAWGALALGEPVGPELIGGFALVMLSLVLVLGLRPSVPGGVARLVTRLVAAAEPGRRLTGHAAPPRNTPRPRWPPPNPAGTVDTWKGR